MCARCRYGESRWETARSELVALKAQYNKRSERYGIYDIGMPLLRLIAEGVGPFERLDVDLSDGKGNPHLGPHIFAGVNGSGKSTILGTLAWAMDSGKSGFRYADWAHLTAGYTHSRALVVVQPPGATPYARACTKGTNKSDQEALAVWARSVLCGTGFDERILQSFQVERSDRRYELFLDPSFLVREASRRALPKKPVLAREEDHGTTGLVFQDKREAALAGALLNVAAYSPSRALRHVAAVDLTKTLASPHENSLAFESTVQNKFVQSWLLSLYSKRAIARERDQSADQYTRSLYRFENALRLLSTVRASHSTWR